MIEYFKNDPLKMLYLIGGGGGVWFWITKWKERIRIKVTLKDGVYNPADSPNSKFNMLVEIINLGNNVTALAPQIKVSALTKDRERIEFNLNCTSNNRQLKPHEPTLVEYEGTCPATFLFSWYKKFRFRVTRGRGFNLLLRSADKTTLSKLNYYTGYVLFKLFNKLPGF